MLLTIVAVIVAILISMTLHEAMHGYMAHWLGDDTAERHGRLTLNPAAHIDPFYTLALPIILIFTSGVTGGATPIFGAAKPVPFNPFRLRNGEIGMAMVGFAGPLANLFLAAVAGLALRVIPGDTLTFEFLILFVNVNLSFFVFNMIPWPPLDGSRILYAISPAPIREILNRIEQFGLIGLFLLLFVGLPVISPLIGLAVSYLFEIFTGLTF